MRDRGSARRIRGIAALLGTNKTVRKDFGASVAYWLGPQGEIPVFGIVDLTYVIFGSLEKTWDQPFSSCRG